MAQHVILIMNDSLESIYSGKIRMEINEVDGDTTYLPKFNVYNEFVNLDGIFKLDSSIIKVTETKVISFTDPSKISNFEIYGDNTLLDDNLGVVPNDITTTRTLICNCDNPKSGNIFINYGTFGRRFKMQYSANLAVAVVRTGSTYSVTASIKVNADAVHQQKKLIGWWNHRIDSRHTFRANGRVESVDLGINSTWDFPSRSIILLNYHRNGDNKTILLGVYNTAKRQPDMSICIDSANQIMTRLNTYEGVLSCN